MKNKAVGLMPGKSNRITIKRLMQMDVSVFFVSVFFVSVNQGVINSCRFLKNGPLCGPLTLGVRNKDFQEVTVFGINKGDHIPPFDGKVSFLSKKARKGKPRCVIDWSMFVEEKKEDVTFRETRTYGIEFHVQYGRLQETDERTRILLAFASET